MMKCPRCGKLNCYNLETRKSCNNRMLRRRKCKSCGYIFTTYEVVVPEDRELTKREEYYLFMRGKRGILHG